MIKKHFKNNNVNNNYFIFFFLVIFNFISFEVVSSEEQKKMSMIRDLEVIKHHFEVGYAPGKWKNEYAGWDINAAFENARTQILTTPSLTTKQFHQIVREFMGSMKDYHVDVLFYSTEKAQLPFSVKGVEGRYFVSWVDPLRLSSSYFGLNKGDELLEFNGQPVGEVIDELEAVVTKSSNPKTDRALAEMRLTSRQGMYGDVVPKGVVYITTRSESTRKIIKYQLRWSYSPEHINHPFDIFSVEKSFSFANFSLIDPPKPKLDPFQLIMANPLHQAIAQESTDRDGGLGSRKSFIPPLGEILWSSEDIVAPEEGSNNQNIEEIDNLQFWHAYIYRHPNDYAIGYIRIPHYLTSTQEVIGFGKIIDMMNEQTDALVIDQVHNFGGFIHIQYLLASMLTHQPLITPLHRIKITQKDAKEAYQILEIIKLIEREINFAEKMNQEPKVEGEEGLNHQELLFRKAYCELILENWNKGQYLTDPTPVIGIDHINPHPTYRYEKPILMLIDEMDFSGGDFMPAILQDNQRAYLFGARTAGAGGYVSQFEFPNINGIASCSYTASIAERVDFKKIENLGVTPDIPYHITLDDVKNGFCGYIDGVNQSIDLIIKNNK